MSRIKRILQQITFVLKNERIPVMRRDLTPSTEEFLKLMNEENKKTIIEGQYDIDANEMFELMNDMETSVPYSKVEEFLRTKDIDPQEFKSFMR